MTNHPIYAYTDICEFLQYYLQSKKPDLSIRKWAGQLEIKQHNHLHDMINGRRKIPSHYIPNFVKNLSLDNDGSKYFELLVLAKNSKKEEERTHFKEKVETIQKAKLFKTQSIDDYRFLKDPIHLLILELTTLDGFTADPQWIRDRINLDTTIEEIEEAITLIKQLGLVEEGSGGKFLKSKGHIYSNNEINDLAVRKHVQKSLLHASKEIMVQSEDDMETQNFMFNIKKEDIPTAKKLIRRFIKEMLVTIEAKPFMADETYQLGVQFFSLTNNKE